MEHSQNMNFNPELLKELGLTEEFIKQAVEKGPAVNTHVAGGHGGRAINLTYVDNYSTLLLVYTFLLNFLDLRTMELKY
ncbi:hypothetical protein [Cytobacillus purgationiresistens]|uniref:Uncharacterized protein n=1 Tax=Cytobacillus purgationiresistens TaxID=863449 RepID=A0ABU0AHF4_9BACI|nr:hypothetical protein [Cytobacillus purgationiresistens]MDQ0270141.1 hypothetical protein [Cytobacillus purgationiresistens]